MFEHVQVIYPRVVSGYSHEPDVFLARQDIVCAFQNSQAVFVSVLKPLSRFNTRHDPGVTRHPEQGKVLVCYGFRGI